jgi:hypothetical protein
MQPPIFFKVHVKHTHMWAECKPLIDETLFQRATTLAVFISVYKSSRLSDIPYILRSKVWSKE